MDLHYYRELLRKYREGTCSDEERRLLDAWYESLQFDTRSSTDDERAQLTEKNWQDLLARRQELGEYANIPASN